MEKRRFVVDTLGKLVVAVFTVLAGGLVVLLVICECYQYFRGDSLLDARQFRFRMVGAGVLLALLAMMCVGVYVVHFTDLVTFALYWSGFAVACLIPAAMSVLDLRRLNRLRQERQRALGEELVEFIREQNDRLQAGASAAERPTGSSDD